MTQDYKIDDNGDFVLNANGDFQIIYGDEYLAQEIMFRMKTTKGDCLVDSNVGCSLEQFIGQPNTPSTLTYIEKVVSDELTRDSLILDPVVNAVSVNANEVLIVVEFPSSESNRRIIQIISGLDLLKGLVFSRIDSRSNL